MKGIVSSGTPNRSWKARADSSQVHARVSEPRYSAHPNWVRREIHVFLGAKR